MTGSTACQLTGSYDHATKEKDPASDAPAPVVPPAKALAALSDVLAVAADPTRLRIVHLLADGERNVGEIVRIAGGVTQSGISHHLKSLSLAGIVEAERRGKFVYYAPTAKGRAMRVAMIALLGDGEATR